VPPPPPDLLVPPRALNAQNAALFAAPSVSGLVAGASVGSALRLSRTALDSISVSIPLPNSPSAIFTRDRMWTMADGSVRLHGAITIGTNRVDDVYLLARNGSLTGDFTIGANRYELVQVAPALSRVKVASVTQSAAQNFSALKTVTAADDFIRVTGSGPLPAGVENGSSIKLLVAYTAAYVSPANLNAQRQANMLLTDAALKIPVGTSFDDNPGWLLTNEFNEANYFSAAGPAQIHKDFTKASLNVWSEIGRQRNLRKADIAHLGTGSLGQAVIGYGYVPAIPAPANFVVFAASWSQSLYNLDTRFAFTHELGHNLGGYHEHEDIANEPGYNYDYVTYFAGNCLRTILAKGTACSRINSGETFSNPNVLLNGAVPAGIPVGQPGAAHNVFAFQNNKVSMANLRGPAVTQDLALGAKIFAAPDFTTHALVRVANHAGNAMAAPKIDFTFPEYAQGPPGPGYYTSISIILTPAGWTCATRGGAAFAVPTASYECTTSSFAVNGEVEFELAPLALFGGGGGPFTVGAYPRNLDPTVFGIYGSVDRTNNDDSGFLDNGF
jgi:hypothetical protein